MDRRFQIAEAARAEIAEMHGELAAISVYALADVRRGFALYMPIGGNVAIPLFADQVEELR